MAASDSDAARPSVPPGPPADQSRDAEKPAVDRTIRHGTRPGDVYVRLIRHRGFRRVGPGRYEIRAGATTPKRGLPRLWSRMKRLVIGEPLATAAAGHERLTKVKALAVLSSDALSSVAYATEEILKVLLLAGSVALWASLPIAGVIVALLAVVGFSYRQTIKAYPKGGGSYIVAKDNLGTLPGLTAGASLLVSYVLTVAVSVTAGVLALTSAYPALEPWLVQIGVGLIALITLINLRGIRESGTIFMIPTYAFLACMVGLLVVGLARFGLSEPLPPREVIPATETLTLFLALRAFASGGAALTGVEAISDGVPAFRPPEWVNAQRTLTAMVIVLGITFAAITFLAHQLGVVPIHEGETVVSQIARAVFGEGPLYLTIQFATMLILVLAANTAYSDFPRLAYFLARDGFLPRQFTFRGDRLAYTTGIVALGVFSSLVLWIFGGSISALIPLYAFGVFSAFTLSQSGMVARWWKRREPGWKTSIMFNGIGAVATSIVLLVVAITKFIDGAWLAVILLPILIALFRLVHHHYTVAAHELQPETPTDQAEITHQIVVPISRLNRVALQTLAYARSIARGPRDSVTAVHIVTDLDEAAELSDAWQAWQCGVPLVQLESPYRSLVGPLLAYVDSVHHDNPRATVSVILPEFVPRHWWEQVLHNQTALRIKAALLFRPGIVVTSMPYHLRPGAAHGLVPSQAQAAPEKPSSPEGGSRRNRGARIVRPGPPRSSG
ncbi:MAG: APC family permease [Chloroflexi bacterium]|nr:APC family permease [Chloroflexota bacterium]